MDSGICVFKFSFDCVFLMSVELPKVLGGVPKPKRSSNHASLNAGHGFSRKDPTAACVKTSVDNELKNGGVLMYLASDLVGMYCRHFPSLQQYLKVVSVAVLRHVNHLLIQD